MVNNDNTINNKFSVLKPYNGAGDKVDDIFECDIFIK